MHRFLLAAACLALAFFGKSQTPVVKKILLKKVAEGLEFPVDIAQPTSGDDRLFIVGENGKIQTVGPDGSVGPQLFLDLSGQILFNYAEMGLLGMAFDPHFESNGFFYVFYSAPDSASTVARFQRSATDPTIADPTTKTIVMSIPQISFKHKGGCLKFGPDGFLYLSTGDSSLGGDPLGNAQNDLSFFGKILRIDVSTLPYSIPPTNPFVVFSSKRGEIWADGLRNPWRFSFDRGTGDLWLGDVGQDHREEIDFEKYGSAGGRNYGWHCLEGSLPFDPTGCMPNTVFTPPIYEYENPGGGGCGASVTGGFVYRGSEFHDLQGWYIFADVCKGWFRGLKKSSNGPLLLAAPMLETNTTFNWSAFGENHDGELFVVGYADHNLYKITSFCAENPLVAPDLQQNGDSLSVAWSGSVEWFRGDSLLVGATDSVLRASISGDYFAVVVDANGCSATTDTISLLIISTTENLEASKNGLRLRPNPCADWVELDFEHSGSVEIKNALGEPVFQTHFEKNDGSKKRIETTNWPTGIYFVTAILEHEIFTKRLVVR